jgi:hypothetical protein
MDRQQANIYKKIKNAGAYSTIVKVKESRNRLGVAQRVPGGLDSQIS